MSQQRPRPTLPSPSTGTLGAVVAVVALVLGFLILRDVKDNGGSTLPTGTTPTATTPDGGTTPTATTVPFAISGFRIQVANASGMAGSAGKMTTDLQGLGYIVYEAVNVPPGTAKRAKTAVFYLAGCEAASQNVAGVLGNNVEVAVMPQPIPVETGSIKEACILILLGTDLANKPLAGVVGAGNGIAATTTSTTIA